MVRTGTTAARRNNDTDPSSSSTQIMPARPTMTSARRASAPDQSGRNRATHACEAAPTDPRTNAKVASPTR